MHPVLFRIPGLDFPVRTFGVLVAAGFLLSLYLWQRLLARHGADPENDPARGSRVAVWILIGVLGGARIAYATVEAARYLRADLPAAARSYLESSDRPRVAAVIEPRELEIARQVAPGYDFLHDPIRLLFIWQGGLVMYGGLLGAVLIGLWTTRREGMQPWNVLDTGLVAGFAGQAVGRWGCLFVGDDYGSIVPPAHRGLPFPITVQVPGRRWLEENPESLFPTELAGKTLWATQIWMSANALLIALVGWLVLRRSRQSGWAAAWVLVLYGIGRSVIEAFRGDEVRGLWFGGTVSTSQLLSIPIVLVGLYLLVKRRPGAKPFQSWPPKA